MANRALGVTAVLGFAALLGCQDAVVSDPTLCEQTYEFGNYGCVEVTGQVVGANGQPIMNVPVGAGSGADEGRFDRLYPSTDAQGRFDLRMHQMVSSPASASDSVSLWIRAVVVPVPPQLVAAVKDSVLVRLRVTAVGSRPEPAIVTIVLPTP